VVLAVLVAALLAFFAPAVLAAAPPAKSGANPPAAEPAPPVAPLTREQLSDRLQKLAETPPPTQLSTGADCYKVAMPPDTADHVCPRDGSRTSYSKNATVARRVRELPSLRQAASTLPGIKASIDDSEFCRVCTPKAPADPQPVLVVTLPGGGERRTRAVTDDDLQVLREFAMGSLKHEGGQGYETPLKDRLPRIRELLGMDDKPKPSK
jgi:hypothetical protein